MSHLPATFSSLTGSGLAVSGSSLSSLPRSVTKPVQRELDWLSGRSKITQAQDNARAELTAQAMTNIGTLVMTGQSLAQIAPKSTSHLEALLSAYTVSAAHTIARFQ